MSEEVLQALSAVGNMGMDTFNACFSSLSKCDSPNYDTFDVKDIRYRTLRIMSALGHCEPDFDRRNITVCPPVIISLPQAGLPRAVLTGARTVSMISKLHKFEKENRDKISVELFQQYLTTHFSPQGGSPNFSLPNAVIIEALSHETLQELCQYLKVRYLPHSPVPIFLEYSANISNLNDSLEFKHFAEPNWTSWIFNPNYLKFEKGKNDGKYPLLASYVRPIDQQRLHIYWVNGKGAEIDRDWARWLILSNIKSKVILYDNRQQLLGIPATLPLPGLLARSAVLCSGRAPISTSINDKKTSDIPSGHPMDLFLSVPFSIAKEISSKLNQNLQNYRFALQNRGE